MARYGHLDKAIFYSWERLIAVLTMKPIILWKRDLSGARHFSGYSFFAVEKRVTSSKGFELKTSWMTISEAHAW
jgi:hypothetical protein